jgi:hypothetical protein
MPVPVHLELTKDLIGLNTIYTGVITDFDVTQSYELKCANPDYLSHIKYILTDFTGVTEILLEDRQATWCRQKTHELLQELNPNLLKVDVAPTDMLLGDLRKSAIIKETEHQLAQVVSSRNIAITLINQHLNKISPRELYYSNVFLDHINRNNGGAKSHKLSPTT